MPRGSPFTALCQQTARGGRTVVADLHTHTTASDGDFRPDEVLAFARRARLTAVAITDHDTLAGVPTAAEGVRVVPGVEVSADLDGRETHVLGLFVRVDHQPLVDHLAGVCERRRERFFAFVRELAAGGTDLPAELVAEVAGGATSLGRRHVAGLLLRAGRAKTRYEAFSRFLHPLADRVPKSHLTPAADAVRLLRDAGGVVALAHPPRQVTEANLTRFRDLGGQAVEVVFPAALVGHSQRLRGLCKQVGLAVAGGSDCHGADIGRGVGSRGVTRDEFAALEALAGRGERPV